MDITDELLRDLAAMKFKPPVTHVYNPLEYARESWDLYVRKYGKKKGRILLLGMNPGPFGMAQTGIPFGEISAVRDWMGISARVGRPSKEHPKRPIQGFECTRSEVSGRRLWGWARDRFATPARFFDRFFVFNYCPLVFMSATGSNVTPDKLPAGERAKLFKACDRALLRWAEQLEPEWVIGVGGFADARAREALESVKVLNFGQILHPSPANPRANKDWEGEVERKLRELGLHFAPG